MSKKGKKFTEEHKNNIRLSKLGKKRKPFSKEWKENIRKGLLGKKCYAYIDGRYSKTYYCIDCGKEISKYSGIYGEGRCQSCATKYIIKIKGHPLLGKHHTEETKEKIRQANSGKNNPNYKNGVKRRKVYCLDCGKRLKNNYSKRCHPCARIYRFKHLSKKERQEMSERVSGNKNPMFGKIASHGKWTKYKKIWMRSTWEVKFAQFLTLSAIKWQYEPKYFNLGNTTYTPDFYIPEWGLWIEIKSYWRDDAKEKFDKFKKKYPKESIKVLMQEELQQLGVL